VAVLADTSCWIEYFHPNGAREVKVKLRDAIALDRVAVCGPVVCEVLRGAGQADRKRIQSALAGQLHLSQEDADWLEVARTLGDLQKKGLQPPILDVLVSVMANRHAATLWHFGDRHFAPIGRILGLEIVDLKR